MYCYCLEKVDFHRAWKKTRSILNTIVGSPLLITLQLLSTYHPWVKILVSLRKEQLEITNQNYRLVLLISFSKWKSYT
jgi:hypothetical protein